MKKNLVVFSLIFFVPMAFAKNLSRVVDMVSTNLGTTYNTSSPQLVMSGISFKTNGSITNTSVQVICCNTETASFKNPPSSTNKNELCVAPSSIQTFEGLPTIPNVYCRTMSGTSTSGLLILNLW